MVIVFAFECGSSRYGIVTYHLETRVFIRKDHVQIAKYVCRNNKLFNFTTAKEIIYCSFLAFTL